MMLLHGEESLFFEKHLEIGKTYKMQERISDIQDKKSGALVMMDNEIREADTNDLCVTVRMSLFIRGIGGFGYKGTIKSEYPSNPKRNPDMVQEEKN
jgi:3-hydroxyacyl-CoA dehydrogenase/3a,7a,12a-trihydroxy-5b-cholest-24-enoyl-CoA hydratase/multifunctional beta-oxidation protein/peroxisomal enoyl-CoA hydratase 2